MNIFSSDCECCSLHEKTTIILVQFDRETTTNLLRMTVVKTTCSFTNLYVDL